MPKIRIQNWYVLRAKPATWLSAQDSGSTAEVTAMIQQNVTIGTKYLAIVSAYLKGFIQAKCLSKVTALKFATLPIKEVVYKMLRVTAALIDKAYWRNSVIPTKMSDTANETMNPFVYVLRFLFIHTRAQTAPLANITRIAKMLKGILISVAISCMGVADSRQC